MCYAVLLRIEHYGVSFVSSHSETVTSVPSVTVTVVLPEVTRKFRYSGFD